MSRIKNNAADADPSSVDSQPEASGFDWEQVYDDLMEDEAAYEAAIDNADPNLHTRMMSAQRDRENNIN